MNKKAIAFLLLPALVSCAGNRNENPAGEITAGNSVNFPDTTAFDPSWSKENVLVYHTISEPDNLHPTNGSSSPRGEINLYINMGLIATDLKNQIVVPALVKSLPEKDNSGLEYTF